jgi:uracil-DNA glycosylase family 4
MQPVQQILDETIRALEKLKRDGLTHVAVRADTLEALARPLCVAPAPAPGRAATGAVRDIPAETAVADLAGELGRLQTRAMSCVKCAELARCRHNVVFGVGNPRAELMFVGEAPGRDEDLEGEPFVGRAGELLTRIIQAMGLKRGEVYIANVIKCRPPQNRTPLPEEVENCLPYLVAQIELIRPRVIVALGAVALRALLDLRLGITKLRGNWYTWRDIPIMPTFHPAYLLRNPAAKKDVWRDMRTVLEKLGRTPPPQSAARQD